MKLSRFTRAFLLTPVMLPLRSRSQAPLFFPASSLRSRALGVLTALSGLIVAGCAGSAPRPAAGPQPNSPVRGTVGILPFSTTRTDTTLTPLAFALADLLSTDLSRSGRVRIVERARFGEVLRELDLAATGRLDSATAPRVGRLVNAERMVFGTLAALPDGRTLRLGARVDDVEGGAISKTIDAQAPLAEILAAEKALALRLFESLGVILTPAEKAAIEAQPTKNIGALVAYGRGMQRYYEGDYRGAASAMRQASRLDPSFREPRDRERQIRTFAANGVSSPIAIPGVRPLDGAISSAVDRLNRPLDLVTNVSRALSSALDPTFPAAQATVIITITRP